MSSSSSQAPSTSRKRRASQMAEFQQQPEWAPVDVEFDFSTNKKPGSYDRILTVGGVDFHVLKAHLANHSEFFNGMLFPPIASGGYLETNQAKIELREVTPATFQYFLELIGGGNRLDDSNIREVLAFSNRNLCSIALEKCEQFLVEKSKLDRLEKMELAHFHGFEGLKTHLIANIKNLDDLDSTIPESVNLFDKKSLLHATHTTLGLLGIHRPRFPDTPRFIPPVAPKPQRLPVPGISDPLDFCLGHEGKFDVVLKVQKRQFYVMRQYLGVYSPVLHSMLCKDDGVVNENEVVELEEVPADGFQVFLEMINGKNRLSDSNIESVLQCVAKYEARLPLRECEQFLVNKSSLEKKKILGLTEKFNMQKLKQTLFNEIHTTLDLDHIVPDDIVHLQHDTLVMVFQKARHLLRAPLPAYFAAAPNIGHIPTFHADALRLQHEQMRIQQQRHQQRQQQEQMRVQGDALLRARAEAEAQAQVKAHAEARGKKARAEMQRRGRLP